MMELGLISQTCEARLAMLGSNDAGAPDLFGDCIAGAKLTEKRKTQKRSFESNRLVDPLQWRGCLCDMYKFSSDTI